MTSSDGGGWILWQALQVRAAELRVSAFAPPSPRSRASSRASTPSAGLGGRRTSRPSSRVEAVRRSAESAISALLRAVRAELQQVPPPKLDAPLVERLYTSTGGALSSEALRPYVLPLLHLVALQAEVDDEELARLDALYAPDDRSEGTPSMRAERRRSSFRQGLATMAGGGRLVTAEANVSAHATECSSPAKVLSRTPSAASLPNSLPPASLGPPSARPSEASSTLEGPAPSAQHHMWHPASSLPCGRSRRTRIGVAGGAPSSVRF